MARRCSICDHDSRPEIDRSLVEGEPYRHIAARFGTSTGALQRHKADHLPRSLLQARAAQEQADAIDVMAELERCFERVNLLFDACDRWLRDPTDPDRYDIGPRAEELMVTYTEPTGPIGKPVRRKAPLSELLARAEGEDRSVKMVETKHADPRDLVLKTAGRLQPQIELLAKLLGELDNSATVNILASPEWLAIRSAVLGALAPHPEARASVSGRLLELGDGS